MKPSLYYQVVSVVLAGAIALTGVKAFETRAQAQIAQVVFVLGFTCLGIYSVITIMKKNGVKKVHRFILQRRVEVAAGIYMWKNVCTNQFTVEPEQVYAAFLHWQETNGPAAKMFRIMEVEPEPDGFFNDGTQVVLVQGGVVPIPQQ